MSEVEAGSGTTDRYNGMLTYNQTCINFVNIWLNEPKLHLTHSEIELLNYFKSKFLKDKETILSWKEKSLTGL